MNLPLLLLFSASAWPMVDSRGTPINLYEQPGNWHRGPGDIANLWVGFTPSEGFRPGPVIRNAIKSDSQNRWTRYQNDRGQFIIPYIISGKFEGQEYATIARAMLAIAENTCIKFEKRGGEADFVDLKNERGEGCYTVVGRLPGKNTVMLETNEIATCLEFDIVIHELMHTIGLWHEQMRYDRDEFIKIHWENIGPAYVTQFEKVPDTDSTTYGVRYDYQSVMHYAKDAFASAPGKLTMETLDKQFQEVIGKVRDASPSDYLKICNIYACHTCMGRPFNPGQSRPVDGQRVITLGPGPVTLPTASPSPATLPLGTTTTVATATKIPKGRPQPPATSPASPISPLKDSKEKEDRRVRPTPILPIILPLINNNWWWKNTPAPPLRDPHGRMLMAFRDEGEGNGTKEGQQRKGKGGEEGEEEEGKSAEWREVPEIPEEKSLEEEEEEVEEKHEKGEKGKEKKQPGSSAKRGRKKSLKEEEGKKKEVEEEKKNEVEVEAKIDEEEEEEEEATSAKPPKRGCQDNAAFCVRLFHGSHQSRLAKSAVKTCALEVIKRHCCRSCRGHGRHGNGEGRSGKDEEELKEIEKVRRSWKRMKGKKPRRILEEEEGEEEGEGVVYEHSRR